MFTTRTVQQRSSILPMRVYSENMFAQNMKEIEKEAKKEKMSGVEAVTAAITAKKNALQAAFERISAQGKNEKKSSADSEPRSSVQPAAHRRRAGGMEKVKRPLVVQLRGREVRAKPVAEGRRKLVLHRRNRL